MTIAFTLCSNNYLAQAKTLGDSFLEYHPDAKFIIGLVDRYDATFDYDVFKRFEIIPVEDIQIDNLDALIAKYNIVELNTCVKPAYIHYIFRNYRAGKVLYLDPDILVTGYFEEVLDLLDQYNIVLTPHICTPVDDEFAPTDYQTLRGGVFNLGFIALSNYNLITPFLNWWHERVIKYGYADFTKNMFYDQVWINYVPVMFDDYYILKHPGYNMAVWNLHERWLNAEHENYMVNDIFPLKFYHFSGYKYDQPEKICNYEGARFDFEKRPGLKKIYTVYQEKLLKNKIDIISGLSVFFRDIKLKRLLKKPGYAERILIRLKLTTRFFLKGSLH